MLVNNPSNLLDSVTDDVKLNKVAVVGNEINADNGEIHTMSTVLIPKH